MPRHDKRVDTYIAKSPEFARPILTRIREIVHEGCPDCEETIKWGGPSFTYNGILCGMRSFKEYCGLHFWKGALVLGEDHSDGDAAQQFGRITKVSDLPPKKVLIGYVRKAMELNDSETKVARPTKPRKELATPAYLTAALRKNKKAQVQFEAFSPSAKREYVEWLIDAKTEDTRARRLEQAVEWIAEGKHRNWKYQ